MVAATPSAAKRARPAALASRVTTIKLPALGRIYSLVAGQAGMLFVGTRSALYLLANGRIALCAGHPSETASTRWRADGMGSCLKPIKNRALGEGCACGSFGLALGFSLLMLRASTAACPR